MRNAREGSEFMMTDPQPKLPIYQNACISSLLSSADACRARALYPQAESLYQQALALATSTFGPDHPEVAPILNSLAVLHKYTGDFVEAERLYRRALAITEQALGPDHPQTATIYHNLGGLEHARGCYAQGEPFARQAVEIRRKALGPDHADVAADLAALAAILDGLGKYQESERSTAWRSPSSSANTGWSTTRSPST
jgi:tetratricopeptide (TPR) repeat protein